MKKPFRKVRASPDFEDSTVNFDLHVFRQALENTCSASRIEDKPEPHALEAVLDAFRIIARLHNNRKEKRSRVAKYRALAGVPRLRTPLNW